MGTCHDTDCEAPATDERHGWSWCRDHFFRVLQWEQVAA